MANVAKSACLDSRFPSGNKGVREAIRALNVLVREGGLRIISGDFSRR